MLSTFNTIWLNILLKVMLQMNTGYSRQRTADSMIQLRQFSICSDLESYFRRQSKAILN